MNLTILVGSVLTGVLALFGLYHAVTVVGYEGKIATYVSNEAIYVANEETLKRDIQDLKDSNESLENSLQAKRDEMVAVRVEVATLRAVEAASQERMKEVAIKLSSKDHIAREEDISNGRRRALLLKYTNANVACELANITDVNGKCVAGVWRPTDRSLPRISYLKNRMGVEMKPRKAPVNK